LLVYQHEQIHNGVMEWSGLVSSVFSVRRQRSVARSLLAVCLGALASFSAVLAGVPAPTVHLSAAMPSVALAGVSQFLVDPGGRLDVASIESRQAELPFALRPLGHKVLLDDGDALWIRFSAKGPELENHWLLEVDLPGVDGASLYYRSSAGAWVVQRAGDGLAQSLWTQRGRFPMFSISHEVDRDVTYWLRINHARVPFSGGLFLRTQAFAAEQEQRALFLLGAYFGLAALAIFIALANALVYRDRGFGTYVVYIAAMVLAQAGITGVGGMLFWPEMPGLNNPMTLFMPMVAGAMGVWFVRTVVSPRQYSALLDRLTVGIIVALLAVAGFDAVMPSTPGFELSMHMLVLCIVLVLLLLGLAIARGDRHSRWIAAGFSLLVMGSIFPLMRNIGLIPSGFLTEYGMMLGSALEMPLLFYGLNRRLKEQTETRARARALAFMDPLTGLSSQRKLLTQLQTSIARAQSGRPVALMVIELANLERLTREHGSDGADRALVLAASRLKSVVRDIDTVARVGNPHFAVLMESPCTLDEANAIATHVVAQGLRTSSALSDGATLRFHIALAMLPLANLSAQASLQTLLKELKLISPDARKTIRLVKG
jgi:diguanylate cyclase (GGDEF)-like protein